MFCLKDQAGEFWQAEVLAVNEQLAKEYALQHFPTEAFPSNFITEVAVVCRNRPRVISCDLVDLDDESAYSFEPV